MPAILLRNSNTLGLVKPQQIVHPSIRFTTLNETSYPLLISPALSAWWHARNEATSKIEAARCRSFSSDIASWGPYYRSKCVLVPPLAASKQGPSQWTCPGILTCLLFTHTRNSQKLALIREASRSLLLSPPAEFVQGSLRDGGSVLIPVDTAGRVLEVILCLEHYWQSNRAYQEYPIALLTSVSYNVVDFAKSSLEWMADNIGKHFERARANAFDLRYCFGSLIVWH
jgi:hypothetical protein